MLLGKAKLNTIEVLSSKALIKSYTDHDKFIVVNNALREYNEMKEKVKNPLKNTPNKHSNVRRTKQNRLMLVSNCAICGREKSRFIKTQEATRLELH